MKKYYGIAFDFNDVSDEDVDKLKYHIIEQVGDTYGWKDSNDMKLLCRKEWSRNNFCNWSSGTHIDMYVACGQQITHLYIDQDDMIIIPIG